MRKSTLWLSVLSGSFVLAALPAIVSCNISGGNLTRSYVSSDIGGLRQEFNPEIAEDQPNINEKLVEKVKQIKESTSEADKKKQALLNQRTILITTGGKANDKSFNQSVWEAISKFSRETGMEENAKFETPSISNSDQFDAYDYAVSKGFKFWFLTGFQQQGQLSAWLAKGNNTQRFIDNDTIVVTVDWYPGDAPDKLEDGSIDPYSRVKGRILGLNFRTQEGGFVASYATSKLLSEINADQINNKVEKPKFQSGETYLNSFAGGDFSGSTNFNYGFYEGMRQFNQDMIDGVIKQQLPNKKDAKYMIRSTSPFESTTGFGISNESKKKVELQVDGIRVNDKLQQPQVIFPVAGSLSAVAIDRARDSKNGQWVIGVDTDQSLAFPDDKGLLLTSVEKKIAVAAYKALLTIYDLTDYDGETSKNKVNLLDSTHQMDDSRRIQAKKDNGKFEYENLNSEGGYKEGFVDISKSTLDPNYYKFMTPTKSGETYTYAQRYDEIVKNTWDSFFGKKETGEVGTKGRFYNEKSSSSSETDLDKKYGLKKSSTIVEEFYKNITLMLSEPDENGEQKVLNNINAVLALENVTQGAMTARNVIPFFTPVIDKINKQK